MSTSDRLRRLGTDLTELLEASDRDAFLRAFKNPDGDALASLEALAERLVKRKNRNDDLTCDRTFQLNLALDILRTRDRAAAAQAEWDFAADLQLSGLPQDFPPFP